MDISVRPYKDGDETAISELHCAVNGEIQDKEHWRKWWNWKYKDNPAGDPIYWLAESNGKFVGQYVLIPVKMKVGDEVAIGYQSVDTMTHPDYQRRGIFRRLATETYKVAGNQIIYGFANKYSYSGFVEKLGWFDVGALRAFIKPLKFCYRNMGVIQIDGLRIVKMASFDDRINALWREVSKNYGIMVVRDKEYLNWRYVNVPDAGFTIYSAEKEKQILGYIVVKCEKQHRLIIGRIFDLITPLEQEIIAQALMQKAMEYFRSEKAALILYRLLDSKTYRRILRNSGFVSLPFMNRGLRFIARTRTSNFIKQNWCFVQAGDADTL